MLNNWFLWGHIKNHNYLTSSTRSEGRKHLLMSLAFAVSFLYRAIFNTINLSSDILLDLERDHVAWWCVVFAGLHILGEHLPLTMVFCFQLQRHFSPDNRNDSSQVVLDFSGWDYDRVRKHFDGKAPDNQGKSLNYDQSEKSAAGDL